MLLLYRLLYFALTRSALAFAYQNAYLYERGLAPRVASAITESPNQIFGRSAEPGQVLGNIKKCFGTRLRENANTGCQGEQGLDGSVMGQLPSSQTSETRQDPVRAARPRGAVKKGLRIVRFSSASQMTHDDGALMNRLNYGEPGTQKLPQPSRLEHVKTAPGRLSEDSDAESPYGNSQSNEAYPDAESPRHIAARSAFPGGMLTKIRENFRAKSRKKAGGESQERPRGYAPSRSVNRPQDVSTALRRTSVRVHNESHGTRPCGQQPCSTQNHASDSPQAMNALSEMAEQDETFKPSRGALDSSDEEAITRTTPRIVLHGNPDHRHSSGSLPIHRVPTEPGSLKLKLEDCPFTGRCRSQDLENDHTKTRIGSAPSRLESEGLNGPSAPNSENGMSLTPNSGRSHTPDSGFSRMSSLESLGIRPRSASTTELDRRSGRSEHGQSSAGDGPHASTESSRGAVSEHTATPLSMGSLATITGDGHGSGASSPHSGGIDGLQGEGLSSPHGSVSSVAFSTDVGSHHGSGPSSPHGGAGPVPLDLPRYSSTDSSGGFFLQSHQSDMTHKKSTFRPQRGQGLPYKVTYGDDRHVVDPGQERRSRSAPPAVHRPLPHMSLPPNRDPKSPGNDQKLFTRNLHLNERSAYTHQCRTRDCQDNCRCSHDGILVCTAFGAASPEIWAALCSPGCQCIPNQGLPASHGHIHEVHGLRGHYKDLTFYSPHIKRTNGSPNENQVQDMEKDTSYESQKQKSASPKQSPDAGSMDSEWRTPASKSPQSLRSSPSGSYNWEDHYKLTCASLECQENCLCDDGRVYCAGFNGKSAVVRIKACRRWCKCEKKPKTPNSDGQNEATSTGIPRLESPGSGGKPPLLPKDRRLSSSQRSSSQRSSLPTSSNPASPGKSSTIYKRTLPTGDNTHKPPPPFVLQCQRRSNCQLNCVCHEDGIVHCRNFGSISADMFTAQCRQTCTCEPVAPTHLGHINGPVPALGVGSSPANPEPMQMRPNVPTFEPDHEYMRSLQIGSTNPDGGHWENNPSWTFGNIRTTEIPPTRARPARVIGGSAAASRMWRHSSRYTPGTDEYNTRFPPSRLSLIGEARIRPVTSTREQGLASAREPPADAEIARMKPATKKGRWMTKWFGKKAKPFNNLDSNAGGRGATA